jgi:predicted lipase
MKLTSIQPLYIPLLKAAYGAAPEGRQVPAGCRFVARIGSEEDGYYGMLVQHIVSREHILAIRGTARAEEWRDNFRALPSRFNHVPKGGWIHRGFERQWDIVRSTVFSALSVIPDGSEVTICGHSLGGAMAALGAMDIATNLADRKFKLSVFTVGSPRPGTWTFARQFEGAVHDAIRLTNEGDPVPGVPPAWMAYSHVGRNIQVDGGGEGFGAHSLDAYAEGLRKLWEMFS